MSRVERGQRYYAPGFAADIWVTRVARNGSWADIRVRPLNGSKGWRKRQPLVDGGFGFVAQLLDGDSVG